MLTTPHRLTLAAVAIAASLGIGAAPALARSSFIGQFNSEDVIASAVPTAGPAAGDQNPYGVAVVPRSVGNLVRGDVLVSNFNNVDNQQGTGSSIMEVSPSGQAQVFAVVPPPTSAGVTGLTTGLVALRNGDVIVGNLPAPNGDPTQASAGALTVLNPNGQIIKTITAPDINGPWDMTAADFGRVAVLFVSNVLNGHPGFTNLNAGTVDRIVMFFGDDGSPRVISNRVIATGFTEHLDPNALVVGPTGVGLGRDGTLYVADSANSRIAAIPDALFRIRPLTNGVTVAQDDPAVGPLNDPLGLAIAPGGAILTVNGADGNVVETAPNGHTVAVKTLIPNGGGDLFGLAVAPHGDGVYFVNDAGSGTGANSLELLH